MDEATQSVDALVSEDPLDPSLSSMSATAPQLLPPGFEAASESITLVNPALPLSSRISSAVPHVMKMPPPGLTQSTVARETSTARSSAKKDVKTSTAQSDTRNPTSSSQSGSLQEEDFPALISPNPPSEPAGVPQKSSTPAPKTTPGPKKASQKAKRAAEALADAALADAALADAALAAERSAGKPAPKENGPSVNDETVTSQDHISKADKVQQTVGTAAAEDRPEYPQPSIAATEVGSSDSRPWPKTLRVVPTTKSDVPPLHSPRSIVSRGVSLAQRSETPASEIISDTASVISSSFSTSRAGSPPPNVRVGSAAVRSTTKSQQRKQRKEALKQETKAIADSSKESEEHAPIIGRKKKQKKDQPAKSAISRSAAVQEDTKTNERKPEPADKVPVSTKPTTLESEPTQTQKQVKASADTAHASTPATDHRSKEEPSLDAAFDSSQLGPFSVFTELKSSLGTSALEKLQMLKPAGAATSVREDASQAHSKLDPPTACREGQCKCADIQESDLADLEAGKPVRKQYHGNGTRVLITPNGDCVRGLSQEEEDAFLKLQTAVASLADHPAAFTAPRHQASNGAFSLIKGRAVPNGRPNIFPLTHSLNQNQSSIAAADPITKLQREDALSYINQYVLPRLNLGSSNMGLPKGSGPNRDAAAASLNSLAPYFYGPDAAAGVGIYSPPEGSRNIGDLSGPAVAGSSTGAVRDNHPASQYSVAVGPGAVTVVGPAGAPTSPAGMPLMSVEDAEAAVIAARKETENLEKTP